MAHIIPRSTYYKVFAALMVLTVITVAVAFFDLGPLNTIVALAVAGSKATLVILYFMHVRYSRQLTWVIAVSGFFWLAILLAFTLSDVWTRGWMWQPEPWTSLWSQPKL
jgi:cytochrome c oxidase subunit IV